MPKPTFQGPDHPSLPVYFSKPEEQVLYLVLRASDKKRDFQERDLAVTPELISYLRRISQLLAKKGFSEKEKGVFYTRVHSILSVQLSIRHYEDTFGTEGIHILRKLSFQLERLSVESKQKFLDALFVLSIFGRMYQADLVWYVIHKANIDTALWEVVVSILFQGSEKEALEFVSLGHKIEQSILSKKRLSPWQKEGLFIDTMFYYLHFPNKYKVAKAFLDSNLSEAQIQKAFVYLRSLSEIEAEEILAAHSLENKIELLSVLRERSEQKFESFREQLRKVPKEKGSHLWLIRKFREWLAWNLGTKEIVDHGLSEASQVYSELLASIKEAVERGTAPLIDLDVFLSYLVKSYIRAPSLIDPAVSLWKEILKHEKAIVILNERTTAPISGVLGLSESFVRSHKIARRHLVPPLLFAYLDFLRKAEAEPLEDRELKAWAQELGWQGTKIVPLQYIRVPSGEALSEEKLDRLRNLIVNLSKILGDNTHILFVDLSQKENASSSLYVLAASTGTGLFLGDNLFLLNPWRKYYREKGEQIRIPPIDDMPVIRGSTSVLEKGRTKTLIDPKSVIISPFLPTKILLPHPWLLEQSLSGLIERVIGREVERRLEKIKE